MKSKFYDASQKDRDHGIVVANSSLGMLSVSYLEKSAMHVCVSGRCDAACVRCCRLLSRS